jgi:hypothetical protein
MRRSFIFCALALTILFTQCSPVYVPNSRNTPLFTKAGEAQGAVLFGTSGLDFQGAVAVTNNIAIMGNYSYGNRNTDTLNNDINNYHKHKFYEGALGYYRNDRDFCFEVFVGYGQGEGTSYGNYSFSSSSSKDQLATGKYTRIFFQPSFGFNKKVVHVAFTPRFSWVDFSQFYSVRTTTVSVNPEPVLFFEPAVTAKFNFIDNRFFGTVQGGLTTPLSGTVVFDYEHFIFSTGLGFRIGGLHWNRDDDGSKK